MAAMPAHRPEQGVAGAAALADARYLLAQAVQSAGHGGQADLELRGQIGRRRNRAVAQRLAQGIEGELSGSHGGFAASYD